MRKFRRECCERFPKERMAVLYGSRTPEGVIIADIVAIPHTATTQMINYDEHHIPKSKIKALEAGYEFVGTIHSHPSTPRSATCAHPSDPDIQSALENGELVMAIVYVYAKGTKTDVAWFVPAPLPEVVYQ